MRNENGSMCEMNDFHFRVVLTRTHAGFWFILPFFSILLHAGKRDDVTPTGRAVESRAHRGRKRLAHRARDAQCAAPTKPSLLNQRNMYVDHVKRSRQKSSERKQKTPTGRGGTLGRPPLWRKDGYRYPHMKKVLKLLSR